VLFFARRNRLKQGINGAERIEAIVYDYATVEGLGSWVIFD
jgi:hypothetical protein